MVALPGKSRISCSSSARKLVAPLAHVAGYCVINDVSERNFQLERGSQWDKGKGCDTFGPIGPWLVTRDEIKDVQNLPMFLEVNGERVQKGNTSTMIKCLARAKMARHVTGVRPRPRRYPAAIPIATSRARRFYRGPWQSS